jgi:hypothetical protein
MIAGAHLKALLQEKLPKVEMLSELSLSF